MAPIALACVLAVAFWMFLVIWGLLALYKKVAEATELLRRAVGSGTAGRDRRFG